MNKTITKILLRKIFLTTVVFLLTLKVSSQVEVPLSKRTELTLRGDMKFVSNTILGRSGSDSDDNDVYNPNYDYNAGGLNNHMKMGFIDIDEDPDTFNSSSADLFLNSSCASIKHVGLYWNASYADSIRKHEVNSIKIKYPGQNSYTSITDGTIIHDYINDPKSVSKHYSCYKDITKDVLNLKNPYGTYYVADIPATTTDSNPDKEVGNGLSGGWTMVVIYEDATQTRKRFYVYDGYVNIQSNAKPVTFTFDNFQTILKGAVKSKIGVIAYEGDKGIRGDAFQILSNTTRKYENLHDSKRLKPNFFNASITENGKNVCSRIPSSENTLGYDVDLFELDNPDNSIIGNFQTKADFKISTSSDGYSAMAVAFSIEIYQPTIEVYKEMKYQDHVLTSGNIVLAGKELSSSLTIKNDGNDNAKNTIITDILPAHLDFVPGSIEVPSESIKYFYNEEDRAISFEIPNFLVKKNAEPFTVNFKTKITEDCTAMDEARQVNISGNNTIASYKGQFNSQWQETKGYNTYNSCKQLTYIPLNLPVDMSVAGCMGSTISTLIASNDIPIDAGTYSDDRDSGISSNSGDINPDDLSQYPGSPISDIKTIVLKSSDYKTIKDLIDLKPIYFEFDKWNITNKGKVELDKIVNLMKVDYPNIAIKIETHTDSRGDFDYNKYLSQKRAQSIYKYLQGEGIQKSRILSYQGFGELIPINKCKDGVNCSEQEYQLNRRSEFKIVPKAGINQTVSNNL